MRRQNPLEPISVKAVYPVREPLPAAPLSVNAAVWKRLSGTSRLACSDVEFSCAHMSAEEGRDETGTQARRRDGKDRRAEEGPR